MAENAAIDHHFPETQDDPGRTAENERVDESRICRKFPEKQESKKDGNSGDGNDPFVAAVFVEIKQLVFGKLIHPGSAPSRSD